MKRQILMACSLYWESPFRVGSHHIARSFRNAGWDVLFVSDPISPLHLLRTSDRQAMERFSLHRRGVWSPESGIKSYIPYSLITPHNKPVLSSSFVHQNWMRLTVPNLAKVIRGQGFGSPDLMYLDSPAYLPLFKDLKPKYSIYRIADNNQGSPKATPALEAMERELAKSVDLVIYSAKNLEEYVANFNPRRSKHIPNGVDYSHFSKSEPTLPEEIARIRHPIAIYVGAMDAWFDYELLNQAIIALPDISFVLIGPDSMAKERLRPANNLHILGKRDFECLPQYLQSSDVGIIPFNVKDFPLLVNGINPLKMYEYFASGLPVVATAWDELRRISPPAFLVNSSEEFIAGIRTAATSSDADKRSYREYARSKDWSNSIRSIMEELPHA